MICLGSAPVHIHFFDFFFSHHPPPMAYMTWCQVGWLVYRGNILHGLPTQQVSRKQGVNRCGAPYHSSVISTRRSPQAGVLGNTAPQQVAAVSLSSTSAAAPLPNSVGLRSPAHPVLIGSRVGLPARCVCS